MTTPGKGAQRSTEDCIKMASWNIKEISESLKNISAALGVLTTTMQQMAKKSAPQARPTDDEGIPF